MRFILSVFEAVTKAVASGSAWSPRIGLAWDVNNRGRNVVRAGYGRLFNTIMNGTPGAEETTLRQTSISINNPSYPDPYQGRSPASFASTAPPNISIVSDAMVNPYADTVSLGYSRQLGADLAINLDGVYTKSSAFNANVQMWRTQNGLGPIAPAQISSNGYDRFDIRLSKAFTLGDRRRVELIGQVFNLFGRDILGGIGSSFNTNAMSDAFGRLTSAQPRQQAELAVRVVS